MTFKVLKPFNTATQRLTPGMDVTEDQVAPLDFKHLQDAGFVGAGDAPSLAGSHAAGTKDADE